MEFSTAAKEELREWARHKGPGHFRRTCPDCSDMRRQGRNIECLSISIDHEKALARCWHCEAQGGVRLVLESTPKGNREWRSSPPSRPANREQKGKAIKEIGEALDAKAKTWLKENGISEETALLYHVTWARSYFFKQKAEDHGIAFPYYSQLKGEEGWKVVGHKVRCTREKDHVCHPALYSLFGIQNVDLEEADHLCFVEGEKDTLSMYEAGVINAVSVPNGASSFASSQVQGDQAQEYGFLWHSKDTIEKAGKIIIAVDNDEPGEKLAEELARRIGRHRCWRVTWPEGCKDANDVLLRYGGEILKACVDSAEPWPVAGLYEASRYFPDIDDLYKNGFAKKVSTGMTGVDEIYSLAPGSLTVVTGIPNMGKTTFINWLMVNAARIHGHVSLVCSFETPPMVHIPVLAEMMLQKPFFKQNAYGLRMSEQELKSTYPFINRYFKFIQQEDGEKATIESIIERIKTAILRWGVRNVVIDPYNYIVRSTKSESETQFIDDILTRLRLLAQAYGLHVWFIAHTTKMEQHMDGSYKVPGGFDISGGAGWFSKPDFGITVHQDHENTARVTIASWKVRFNWLGKKGEAQIMWDDENKRYMVDALEDLQPWEPETYA